MIQVIVLYLAIVGSNLDLSNQLVTIFSLIFTLVSICLSICEYLLSKELLNNDLFVIVSFEAQCNEFACMSHKTFRKRVVYPHKIFLDEIARYLKIEYSQTESLKPVHTQKGVMFVMYISGDYNSIKKVLCSRKGKSSVAHVKYTHIIYRNKLLI